MTITNIMQDARTLGFDRNGHLGYIIYESLPELSGEDRLLLSQSLAPMFADNNRVSNFRKYKQHLETSFMRKLFGLTERNGTLLDLTHPDRQVSCQKNCQMVSRWSESFQFANCLDQSFLECDRKFGLILLHECLGHRHGDLAVVGSGDLTAMKYHYALSRDLATGIKCPKQMFVLYFWQGCYQFKVGASVDVITSMSLFHSGMDSLMNKSRVFYGDKLQISLDILRKSMDYPAFKRYCKQWASSKHSRMAKVFKGAL